MMQSYYREANFPLPPLPQVSNDGLPSNNMGAFTGHVALNSILPPSYKGFSQPQVLAQMNMNAPNTTNVIQQQHPPT